MSEKPKVMSNKEFAEKDEYFNKCCEAVGIPATKRQAGRYRAGKGLAYKEGRSKVKQQTEDPKVEELNTKQEIMEAQNESVLQEL